MAAAAAAFVVGMAAAPADSVDGNGVLQVVADGSEDERQLAVQGSAVEWRFRLKNSSAEPFVVSELRTSCDCFSVRLASDRIEGHQSCDAIARVDLAAHPNFVGELRLRASARDDQRSNEETIIDRALKVVRGHSVGAGKAE